MQTILVIVSLPATIAAMAVAFVVTLGLAGPRPDAVLGTQPIGGTSSEPHDV